MIIKLPKWVLVNKFPAFNDLESLTAIEQTARIYGKINELIESYNKYVEEINKTINDFEEEKTADINAFIERITCLSSNYINTIDIKIAHQDRQIAEIYDRFKDDVLNTVKLLVSDLKATGELDNALVEAVGELNNKVDTLIAENNSFKSSMLSDYTTIKNNLNSDYTSVKANLETDYSNTKTALNSDYSTYRENLDSDYESTKANLEDDYTAKKTELDETVSTFDDRVTQAETDIAESRAKLDNMSAKQGAILYDGFTNGFIPKGEPTTEFKINNLGKYSIVKVGLDIGDVICNVSESAITINDERIETYIITGFGTGMLSGLSSIQCGIVNITVNKSTGVVISNNSNSLNILNNSVALASGRQIMTIHGVI